MESNLFTPKEKYHIASTVAVLFLLQAGVILVFEFFNSSIQVVRGYSIILFILFAYVAIRNKVKMIQADKDIVEPLLINGTELNV